MGGVGWMGARRREPTWIKERTRELVTRATANLEVSASASSPPTMKEAASKGAWAMGRRGSTGPRCWRAASLLGASKLKAPAEATRVVAAAARAAMEDVKRMVGGRSGWVSVGCEGRRSASCAHGLASEGLASYRWGEEGGERAWALAWVWGQGRRPTRCVWWIGRRYSLFFLGGGGGQERKDEGVQTHKS